MIFCTRPTKYWHMILIPVGVAQGHPRLLKAAQGRSMDQTYIYKLPIHRTADITGIFIYIYIYISYMNVCKSLHICTNPHESIPSPTIPDASLRIRKNPYHIHTHTQHTHTHTYTHTNTHTHTHIRTYIHTYMHTLNTLHTNRHTYILTYIRIHTYTHTYTYIYIYTCK